MMYRAPNAMDIFQMRGPRLKHRNGAAPGGDYSLGQADAAPIPGLVYRQPSIVSVTSERPWH